jgi:hypothetical protein
MYGLALLLVSVGLESSAAAVPAEPGVALVARFPAPVVYIDFMPTPGPRAPRTVAVSLTVRNNTVEDLTFTFANGQQFEIEVIDASGQVVSRWSRGRVFAQALSQVTIAPGSQRRFGGSVELTYDGGADLREGNYTVKVVLTSITPTGVSAPQSAAPMEIRWVF